MPLDVRPANPFIRWLDESVRAAHLSRREASRRAGLTDSAVHSYLTGRRNPSPDACSRLARFFGVAEDIVLSLAGHRSAPVESNDAREAFFDLLRGQPDEVFEEIERWVGPYLRAHWEREAERPSGPRQVDLSIQMRWDEVLLRDGSRE